MNQVLNTYGTIAMARTADKDSATSQFFINVADNAFLDHGQRDFGYAVLDVYKRQSFSGFTDALVKRVIIRRCNRQPAGVEKAFIKWPFDEG